MRVGILIMALLTLSCLILISPVAAAFPVVSSNQNAGFKLSPDSFVTQANIIHPNDPGSGGGSTGVIK
jgi:hypothetical protein